LKRSAEHAENTEDDQKMTQGRTMESLASTGARWRPPIAIKKMTKIFVSTTGRTTPLTKSTMHILVGKINRVEHGTLVPTSTSK